MVTNVLNFNISGNVGVKVFLPTELETIYRFENVRTVYINGSKEEVLLSGENLNETVFSLKNMLSKALNGELGLHSSIDKFKVGYCWNRWTNALPNEAVDNEDDYFERHWLWSTNETQTWMYNVGNEIYIEISPSYKWHFKEPDDSDIFNSYNEFETGYSEIAILKLETEIARQWLEKCKKVLNIIVR